MWVATKGFWARVLRVLKAQNNSVKCGLEIWYSKVWMLSPFGQRADLSEMRLRSWEVWLRKTLPLALEYPKRGPTNLQPNNNDYYSSRITRVKKILDDFSHLRTLVWRGTPCVKETPRYLQECWRTNAEEYIHCLENVAQSTDQVSNLDLAVLWLWCTEGYK